jgi:hypothetical protein
VGGSGGRTHRPCPHGHGRHSRPLPPRTRAPHPINLVVALIVPGLVLGRDVARQGASPGVHGGVIWAAWAHVWP